MRGKRLNSPREHPGCLLSAAIDQHAMHLISLAILNPKRVAVPGREHFDLEENRASFFLAGGFDCVSDAARCLLARKKLADPLVLFEPPSSGEGA